MVLSVNESLVNYTYKGHERNGEVPQSVLDDDNNELAPRHQ